MCPNKHSTCNIDVISNSSFRLFSYCRYLSKLKEDDMLCRQAQTSGTFYIFHNFSPFLQKVGKKYLIPQLSAAGKQVSRQGVTQVMQLKWYRIICNKQHLTWVKKKIKIKTHTEHPVMYSMLFVTKKVYLELKPWHTDVSPCSSHAYGIKIYLSYFEIINFEYLGP